VFAGQTGAVAVVQRLGTEPVQPTDASAATDASLAAGPQTTDGRALRDASQTSRLGTGRVAALMEALRHGYDLPAARAAPMGDLVPSASFALRPEAMTAGVARAAPDGFDDPEGFRARMPLAAAIWGARGGVVLRVLAEFDREGEVALDLRNPHPSRAAIERRWAEADPEQHLQRLGCETAIEAVEAVWWDRDAERSLLRTLEPAEDFADAVRRLDRTRLEPPQVLLYEASWVRGESSSARLARMMRSSHALPDAASAAAAARLVGLPVLLIVAEAVPASEGTAAAAREIRIGAVFGAPDGTSGTVRVPKARPEVAVILLATGDDGTQRTRFGLVPVQIALEPIAKPRAS